MISPHANTTGGPYYIGYIPDLLRKIEEILGVYFKIHEAPGNSFGYRQSNGQWDGMVGELINKVNITHSMK